MRRMLISQGRMVFALLLFPGVLPAQDSPFSPQAFDVVVLQNGDVITGEVESLKRGRLNLDTDAADNIYIEWEKVGSLTAPGQFEIELQSGTRFFGSLQPGSNQGRVVIVGPTESTEVGLVEVVRITPIESSFWTRLEGLIEISLTFAKANEALNVNSRVDVKYRGRSVEHRLSGSTYLQTQDAVESTSRLTGNWRTVRFLGRRWLLGAELDVERNDELDLDIRAGAGVFGGRILAQTNHVDWTVLVGFMANRERFTSDESTATTFELPAITKFDWFLFGNHETTLNVHWAVFPNLSDFGRVRMEFDASFRRDLFLDFFVALSGYDSFDSRPPTGTSNNDFGVGFSVGYKF